MTMTSKELAQRATVSELRPDLADQVRGGPHAVAMSSSSKPSYVFAKSVCARLSMAPGRIRRTRVIALSGETPRSNSSRVAKLSGFWRGLRATLNQNTIGVQSLPADLAGGGYISAWDNQGNISGRIFENSGAARTAEFTINTTLAGIQTAPQIVGLVGGRAVAVWTDLGGAEAESAPK